MKKAFITLQLVFCICMVVTALNGPSDPAAIRIAGSWKFKSVASENVSTTHYLTTLYAESEYHFGKNNTFTGTFFSLPVSGTWEVSGNALVLNKGTAKEESYTFTQSSPDNLILSGSEKGNTVLIEFEKEIK